MPPKIRQLKSALSQAGFVERANRGKGSHSLWRHPVVSGVVVTLSGGDGDDAKPYQEKLVREAIARVREAAE